jgi:multidrug efflux pump subunit AcrA (membrane-fusion protein)
MVVVGIGLAAVAIVATAGFLGRWGRGVAAGGQGAGVEKPSAAEPQAPAAPATPAKGEAVQVTAGRVVVRPIQRVIQVVGTFWGYDQVTVMAEVPGRVIQVFYDLGDVVRPGDVLLKINPIDYQLAVEETKRAMVADATRAGVPIPPEKEWTREKIGALLAAFDINDVNTAPPLVKRAREQEENAEKRYKRAVVLREDKTITQEAFELVETEYKVARNMREQAELDILAVIAAIRHRLVLLEIAEKKLRDTDVLVPTPTRREGMPEKVEYSVAQRKVSEGEMVKDSPGASTAVFELVMDKVLKLQGNVPERYSSQVRAGQKVEIRVDAHPDRVFEGKVSRVSPVVDRLSRTFPVEILVPNDKRELKPGGFAKAEILTHVDPQAITVPASAVVTFVGSSRVFVVRDGVARAVPVTTGVEGRDVSGGRWVELVGVDPKAIDRDALVVTSGQSQLTDGAAVTLRQAQPAAQPSEERGKKAQRDEP